ncbi:MAG: hypothetical protein IPO92_03940 [Saprospiraceae bacterium]|nr:hypothetical protein [Saprospiraceae bacterium]
MIYSFIELVKYSVPALVVFATVFFLFRNFLNQQYQLEVLKFRQNQSKDILPLKLQAYERLMLFCERISLDNLSYRLVNAEMGVKELRIAMLIAIQQEYEHNISQQVYVSENLWKIIKLAKDQMQDIISKCEGDSNEAFLHHLNQEMLNRNMDPVGFAKSAVKNEAELLL